jgi:L-threonylcarbamoyladenylate synthase
MLASHYAPGCPLDLVESLADGHRALAGHRRQGRHAVLLHPGDDLVDYARTLYAALRSADAAGADVIVAVMPPPVGLGHALRDRLTKAAAPRPPR